MSSGAILYDKPECPFCWRVRMALHRCGIEVVRRDHQQYAAERRALTPTETVPVLSLHGLVMNDSSVMLEYLNDRYGGLWPASAVEAAGARTIAMAIDRTVGAAVRDLVFECRDRAPENRDKAVIEQAISHWHAALPAVERELGDREYFVDEAGITDYVLASRFGLGMAYGMPRPESAALDAWYKRICARAEFTATAPPCVIDALERGWQA